MVSAFRHGAEIIALILSVGMGLLTYTGRCFWFGFGVFGFRWDLLGRLRRQIWSVLLEKFWASIAASSFKIHLYTVLERGFRGQVGEDGFILSLQV